MLGRGVRTAPPREWRICDYNSQKEPRERQRVAPPPPLLRSCRCLQPIDAPAEEIITHGGGACCDPGPFYRLWNNGTAQGAGIQAEGAESIEAPSKSRRLGVYQSRNNKK